MTALDGPGRYIFCVVQVDDPPYELQIEGVDDTPVHVVTDGSVGAVVQPVDEVFDSTDETQVTKWLISHQEVIDAATDAFGTPLPFRFDTILTGDDSLVETWLSEHRDRFETALQKIEGHAEYRITVRWDAVAIEQDVTDRDADVKALDQEIGAAEAGRQYLLERQRDQTLDESIADRREALGNDICNELKPIVDDLRYEWPRESTFEPDRRDDPFEPVISISVIAPHEQEGQIGDRLGSFDRKSHLSVSFTGPWPPYSFAEDLIGDIA